MIRYEILLLCGVLNVVLGKERKSNQRLVDTTNTNSCRKLVIHAVFLYSDESFLQLLLTDPKIMKLT